MKRGAPIIAAIIVAILISAFATGGPITTGSGLQRCYHGSAFYGLCTPGTPLDLRHDCSSGSGLSWDGSNWNCASLTGSGFTNAGSGLTSSGSTVNVNPTAGGMIAVLADSIGLDGSGCSVGWVPTWGSGSAWACAAQAGGGGSGSGTVTSITCGSGLTCSPTTITTTGTISLGAGTGSLSVSTSSFPGSTTNLTTVGTFDWFWWGNTGDPATVPNYANSGATVLHWKKGGELWKSVQWLGRSIASAPGTFPGSTTLTSTASDDSYGTALSATDGSYAQTSGTGFGYQINIPASTTSRTLRLYVGAKGVTTTIAASLDDASASNASTTYNAASGVNVQQTVDIVFQAGSSTRLRVTVTATTLNGGVQAEELWGMAEF